MSAPSDAAVWLDAAWGGPGFFDPPIPFDPSDRGLLLADGAFDTALVLDHRMIWREHHVARLVAACATLGFALDPARVERAIAAMLARVEHGSLRLTVTRGPAARGVAPPADPAPTILAAAAPLRPAALFAPMTLRTTAIRRNEMSPASRIKGLAYADAAIACAEARSAGADDALFLNTRGRVSCCATANLFAILDGRLVTPPLSDGVLDGAGRRVLLRLATALGLPSVERSLLPSDLHRAEAVVATSSLRLLSAVTALDARPLRTAPIAAALADAMVRTVEADGVPGASPVRLRSLDRG